MYARETSFRLAIFLFLQRRHALPARRDADGEDQGQMRTEMIDTDLAGGSRLRRVRVSVSQPLQK
jgi:hypothetical protein